jgi:hypothetical protein
MVLFFILQVIHEYGELPWNDTDRGKPKNSEKTCATVTYKSPWTGPGANPALCGERAAKRKLAKATK